MTRAFGRLEYIIVVERHADGWPHVNILIRNAKLARLCAGDGWKRVRSRWLRGHAQACGFGFITWLAPVKNYNAMSTYIVKLAGEMGKLCQVPMNAPRHFRRLRASRGLLPARPKNEEITGRLTRCEVEEVEARGLSPLPACVGRPALRNLAEPGSDDSWIEYCDVVEPEPGVRRVQRLYTREVLWVEYSFSGSERDCSDSRAGPPGPSAPDDGASGGSGTAWDRSPDSVEDLRLNFEGG